MHELKEATRTIEVGRFFVESCRYQLHFRLTHASAPIRARALGTAQDSDDNFMRQASTYDS